MGEQQKGRPRAASSGARPPLGRCGLWRKAIESILAILKNSELLRGIKSPVQRRGIQP